MNKIGDTMKKILFALLLTGLLYSCEDAINSDENLLMTKENRIKQLLPLNSGSYWIYETTVIDTSGNSFTVQDSLIVAAGISMDGKQYYEMHLMRADTLFSRFHLAYDDGIKLLSRNLHPFLDLDSSMCFSTSDSTPKLLYSNDKNWSKRDSFPADAYPAVVDEGNGPEIVVSQTARIFSIEANIIENPSFPADLPVDYDNKYLTGVEFTGNKEFKIIAPEDAAFKEAAGCPPLEDPRIIVWECALKIIFCADIGILYYDGFSEINVRENGICTAMKTNTSKLIRYHLEE